MVTPGHVALMPNKRPNRQYGGVAIKCKGHVSNSAKGIHVYGIEKIKYANCVMCLNVLFHGNENESYLSGDLFTVINKKQDK